MDQASLIEEGELLKNLVEMNLINHFVKGEVNHLEIIHPEKIVAYIEDKQKEIDYAYSSILELIHVSDSKIVNQSEISGKSVVWIKKK